MTPEYLLEQMIRHGDWMRTKQKEYFAAPFQSEERKVALSTARTAEHQFDKLLHQAKLLLPTLKPAGDANG